MTLPVPHFQLSSSPTFVNFGQNERFSEETNLFLKKYEHFNIFLLKSTQNTRRVVSTNRNKNRGKSQIFNFWKFFSFFKKIQKSSIRHVTRPLNGGKKVKPQLLRRRRAQKKIQNESYLTSKNCRFKMTPHIGVSGLIRAKLALSISPKQRKRPSPLPKQINV